jgi:hypothetical protein
MSLENYFVVRKNPKGGFSYVEGHESDPRNEGSSVFIDIPVTDVSKAYATFDECMDAALEEDAEHGVVTHPECEVESALRDIAEFIKTADYWDDEGIQIKKDGVVIRQPRVDVVIRAAEITE